MSISGKMSMGIRNAAPIPIKVMRIRVATTVYGRFSANSTTDMRTNLVEAPQQSRSRKSRPGSDFSHYAAAATLVPRSLPPPGSLFGVPLLSGHDGEFRPRVRVQLVHD